MVHAKKTLYNYYQVPYLALQGPWTTLNTIYWPIHSYKFQKTKPSSEKRTVHQISMHHHIALVQNFPTFTAPGFYGVYSKLTHQQIDPPKRKKKNTQKKKFMTLQ